MKQLLLLTLYLLLTTHLSAQPQNFIQQVQQAQTVAQLDSIVQGRGQDVLRRGIGQGFEQLIYEMDYRYDARSARFRIKIVVQNEVIVYGTIQRLLLGNKGLPAERFGVQEGPLHRLVAAFNQAYATHYSVSRFLELLDDTVEYTDGCGEAGDFLYKEGKKMRKWTKRQRKTKIVGWLQRPNPEYQAYAVEALLQLQKQGVSLSAREQQLLKYVLDQNAPVRCCLGCLAGIALPMRKMLGVDATQ